MNLKCPACKKGYQHTEGQWQLFHPLAGHGYTKEQGFSSEGARLAYEQDAKNSSGELLAGKSLPIGQSS